MCAHATINALWKPFRGVVRERVGRRYSLGRFFGMGSVFPEQLVSGSVTHANGSHFDVGTVVPSGYRVSSGYWGGVGRDGEVNGLVVFLK